MTNINLHLSLVTTIIDPADYASIQSLNIGNIFDDFYNQYTFNTNNTQYIAK